MNHRYYSLDKFRKRYFSFFILLASILILVSLCSLNVISSTYTPAAPTGPETGFLEIEYEYTIYTTSSDAEWMFDWGDETTSDWLICQGFENSIIESHSWSSAGDYQIRVKFRNNYFSEGVWSNPTTMSISKYCEEDIPNTPVISSGVIKGCINAEYSFSTYATDPKNDYLQYRFDFGDGTISDCTKLVSSGTTLTVPYIWKNTGEYEIKAQAKDQYGLTSEWSEKLNIVIELDSDFDGLSDNIEIQLGSNMNDPSDVKIININEIDFVIISISEQTLLFYNPYLDVTSNMESNNDGTYLIDDNNDGTWNHVYNPAEGSIQKYETSSSQSSTKIPWILVGITGAIIGIILTLLILIKMGYLYFYEEEYAVDK